MIHTSKSIVFELMQKYEISSYYGISKLMKKNPQTVANWVNKGITLDNESARIAADLLGLDFEYVLICMEAERAKKNPVTARAWEHIANAWNKGKPMAISAAFVLFTVVVYHPSSGLF